MVGAKQGVTSTPTMAYMAVEALGLPIELPQPVRRTTADTLKGDGDSLRPAIGPLARTDHFDPAPM